MATARSAPPNTCKSAAAASSRRVVAWSVDHCARSGMHELCTRVCRVFCMHVIRLGGGGERGEASPSVHQPRVIMHLLKTDLYASLRDGRCGPKSSSQMWAASTATLTHTHRTRAPNTRVSVHSAWCVRACVLCVVSAVVYKVCGMCQTLTRFENGPTNTMLHYRDDSATRASYTPC